MTNDIEHYLTLYQQMLKIRLFEEQVNELYTSAKMPGLAHLYSGEEGVAVGVCEALRRDDYITSTHRGHGHCLAKGATVDRMFAELLGKEAGYCHGKGGSMHIADQDTGNLGANAIVGGSAAIATGAAFSSKRLGQDRVAVCFFGDGALGQGLLYESMNMAQLWKLPVIYVCENNLYNEYTHQSETTAGSFKGRAEAFGIHTVEVDGQDVRAVFDTAQELIARARRGDGPAFLLCNTYRYYGHHVGDINRSYYRSKEEEQLWRTERDPLKLLADWLTGEGIADAAMFAQIEKDVEQEIADGVEFALNAPFPVAAEVEEDVRLGESKKFKAKKLKVMVEWSAVPSASGKSKKTSGWVSFVWLMIDKWTSLQDARLARQVIFTQPEHTMDEDTPYALKDYAEKQRRLGLLDSQQNKPLRDYVETMRLERGAAYHIPYFDPCDGGISAQILFLLEAPGGKAVGSGFISRNNPDPTAKNMCELLYAAGISRKDTLLWNIIPWSIGENGKIRSVMRSDFDQAEPYLEKLLKLLSKLKVIVLVGRKAQTKQELIKKLSEAEICEMWHPSNRVKHGSPTKWNEIPIQLKRVSKALAK